MKAVLFALVAGLGLMACTPTQRAWVTANVPVELECLAVGKISELATDKGVSIDEFMDQFDLRACPVDVE